MASIVDETNGVTVLTLYTMEMAPKSSEDNYLTPCRRTWTTSSLTRMPIPASRAKYTHGRPRLEGEAMNTGEPIISVKDLKVQRGAIVLEGVNLDIHEGTSLAFQDQTGAASRRCS